MSIFDQIKGKVKQEMEQREAQKAYVENHKGSEAICEYIVNLFEKYSPFNMKISFEGESTPIISRIDKVEPQDFVKFFRDFRAAYDEYYPLFYMVTVSAVKWYDGFYIAGADCGYE